MNNRDPFNLRQPARASPFSALRATTNQQLHVAIQRSSSAFLRTKDTLAEAVSDASVAASRAAEPMAFAVPRNVPNFQDQGRAYEDTTWGSSGRSRYSAVGAANGHASSVADRIGDMFSDRRSSLPMYKDKPAHHGYGPNRRGQWWRGKRIVGLAVTLFLGILYWMRRGAAPTRDISQDGSWSLWGISTPQVDWDWRRERVRDAFRLSWKSYEENAWGYDEFHPVQKTGKQMAGNGLGWIIVDALDTLIMMNLTTQLTQARAWLSTSLDYDIDHDVNTFETTIRMLGGLLSAHYLSHEFPDLAPLQTGQGNDEDDLYIEKATDLADRLLGAYDSPTGIPYASVNLHTMKGIRSHTDAGSSSTAEATTLQLEMKYLAKLTGEATYWERAEAVMKAIDDIGAKDGLVPIFVNADRGTFYGNNIRLGSRGDSYYEYLIKQYYQTSEQEPIYRAMWDEALMGVRKHLITYSASSNLTVLAERQNGLEGELTPKMDHLVCFLPGTIALGATGGKSMAVAKTQGWTQQQEDDMELARQLMKTCWGMYRYTRTGLAPEITYFKVADPPHVMSGSVLPSTADLDPTEDASWRLDYEIKPADRHNLQRPETVESLLYMWRITGDPMYREWGWEMFQSFIKHTMVEDSSGFSSINDVTRIPPPRRDNMESFWLAETLKYFYMLFSPNDFLPLDRIVFNTEAHPFPRFELGKLFSTGWKRKPRDREGNVIRDRIPIPPKSSTDSPSEEQIQQVIKQVQVQQQSDGSKSKGEPLAMSEKEIEEKVRQTLRDLQIETDKAAEVERQQLPEP